MPSDAPGNITFPKGFTAPNYNLSLICLLLVKAAAILFVIFQAGIGLGPDEAQYWLWSEDLSWGYYSKPPGIAWEIFFGTSLFGSTEFGVRFGAMMLGFGIPLSVYLLAHCCGLKHGTAFWAGAIMAFAPIGIIASFIATTDAGYIFFWTLAAAAMAYKLQRNQKPFYSLIGLLILFGALFKWTIYIFWIVVLVYGYFQPKVRSLKIIPGILISLLGFLPSIYWNMTHQWATFRHVCTQIAGGQGSWFHGNFFDFIGAQIALLSPVFFALLILAYVDLWRKWKTVSRAIQFCAVATCAIFVYWIFSLFMKMQGNWCAFAYPTAVVIICWYACEQIMVGRPWLFFGSLLSIGLTAFVLSIPSMQSQGIPTWIQISAKWNPFRHNVGWANLKGSLKEMGYDPKEHYLVSSRYQISSLASFYSEKQKRALYLNLDRMRKNQFDFWPGLETVNGGKIGFFLEILGEPMTEEQLIAHADQVEKRLSVYFREVQYLGARSLFKVYGQTTKWVQVFQCEEFLGEHPPAATQY